MTHQLDKIMEAKSITNIVPLVDNRQSASSAFLIKRLMDIVLSSLMLLFLSPLFAVVALLIKLGPPGPVIFRQTRVGKGSKHFTCYKFRSMIDGSDDTAHKKYIRGLLQGESVIPKDNGREKLFKLIDDPRITSIGRLLRKTGIDELAQLFNVLKGNMSLVGPRPPIPYEVEMFADWQKQKLAVMPGITGLWVISGRNKLGYKESIELDIEYIKHWSPWFDIKILLKTIPAVLIRREAG